MLHNTSPPLQRWFSNQSNRQQGTLRWLRTFLIAFAILVASAGRQPHRWQKKIFVWSTTWLLVGKTMPASQKPIIIFITDDNSSSGVDWNSLPHLHDLLAKEQQTIHLLLHLGQPRLHHHLRGSLAAGFKGKNIIVYDCRIFQYYIWQQHNNIVLLWWIISQIIMWNCCHVILKDSIIMNQTCWSMNRIVP